MNDRRRRRRQCGRWGEGGEQHRASHVCCVRIESSLPSSMALRLVLRAAVVVEHATEPTVEGSYDPAIVPRSQSSLPWQI